MKFIKSKKGLAAPRLGTLCSPFGRRRLCVLHRIGLGHGNRRDGHVGGDHRQPDLGDLEHASR